MTLGAGPVGKAISKILDLDSQLLMRIRKLERVWLTPVMRVITRLGNADMWFMLGFSFLALGGDGVDAGLRLGAAAIIGTGIAQILKRWCKRERPNFHIDGFIALAENPDHFSFPSGHTVTAWSVAITLIGSGVGLGPLALAFATLVAISRVYLGAHYPLDVGVGILLGVVTGVLVRIPFAT